MEYVYKHIDNVYNICLYIKQEAYGPYSNLSTNYQNEITIFNSCTIKHMIICLNLSNSTNYKKGCSINSSARLNIKSSLEGTNNILNLH